MLRWRSARGALKRRAGGRPAGPLSLLMLLLTRATLLTDQSPFAIALMAAGLAAGTPAWALWAVCVLG